MPQGLLESQKDELFNIIVDHGFNPTDFEWDNSIKGYPTLNYQYENWYAAFNLSQDVFSRYMWISPGKETIEEEIYDLPNWKKYLFNFALWLTYLKKELNADLQWSKLYSSNSISIKPRENLDDSISISERELINQKIETIKKEISILNLDKTSLKTLDAKLDHLTELTVKLGKRDWINLLIGTLGSTFTSLALPPEIMKSIWEIVKVQFEMWLILPF